MTVLGIVTLVKPELYIAHASTYLTPSGIMNSSAFAPIKLPAINATINNNFFILFSVFLLSLLSFHGFSVPPQVPLNMSL
jgi:hypothetical protein